MLATVNAIFITSVIAIDGRLSSALVRALGADAADVTRGLAATVLLLACMTAIPARVGARRMPAEILSSQRR